jgi:hypothetical protein
MRKSRIATTFIPVVRPPEFGARALLAAAGVFCFAGCELSPDNSGTAAGPFGVRGVFATLGVRVDGDTGYCAKLSLQNTSGAAVGAWVAGVQINQSALSRIWDATAVQVGSELTVEPMSWNSRIEPGATVVAFGFCGQGPGRPELSSLSIVGDSNGGSPADPNLQRSTSLAARR